MTAIAGDEVANMMHGDSLRLSAVLYALKLIIKDFDKTYAEPLLTFAGTGQLPEREAEDAD